MACWGMSLVTWRSLTAATSRSVVASLVWVVRRVWLTYWRVVFSFSAMLATVWPVLRRAQMVFWLWLSGDAQFGLMTTPVNKLCLQVFKVLEPKAPRLQAHQQAALLGYKCLMKNMKHGYYREGCKRAPRTSHT